MRQQEGGVAQRVGRAGARPGQDALLDDLPNDDLNPTNREPYQHERGVRQQEGGVAQRVGRAGARPGQDALLNHLPNDDLNPTNREPYQHERGVRQQEGGVAQRVGRAGARPGHDALLDDLPDDLGRLLVHAHRHEPRQEPAPGQRAVGTVTGCLLQFIFYCNNQDGRALRG